MTTAQIVVVAITASIIGFVMLSNKKSAGICAKCGSRSESLKCIDNQLLCEKCFVSSSTEQ